jgi:hypothetical protein
MTAMDTMLLPPAATAFEMASALVSALLYLAVGIAALVRAPNDVRVRMFFLTALASAPAYLVTVLLWARGPQATFTLPVMAVVGLSLMMGSLTLFHFTQVFPWRRSWIQSHWRWLLIGYLVVPVALVIAVWALAPLFQLFEEFTAADAAGSGGVGAVSSGIGEGLALLLVVVVPLLFLVGLVVPFAALMSLYKSWLTAKAAGIEPARVTVFWILISQMAGGVLTILIIPLLHLIAPTGPWVTIAAVLLFAFGLLMPLAFAAGVWKYRVLDLDVEALPST